MDNDRKKKYYHLPKDFFPLVTTMDHERMKKPPPPKEYKLTPEPADTDFRNEFPPDLTIGSELEETARVWRVYRKEAQASDNALLQVWSETLDVLLIFAALFSAVATAFVVESYQLLQPDNTAYTAVALYALATADNRSAEMALPSPPDLAYGTSLSRWINGLWFTSLLLSLAVTLLSILAKQWISNYRARNNASTANPRDWARRHVAYFRALNSWPVAGVVALLPVVLHVSLFLFFAGASAFLWTLDQALGIWVIVVGGILGVFYAACTLMPLWVPDSPTSTALHKQLRGAVLVPMLFILTAFLFILTACLFTLNSIRHSIRLVKSTIVKRIVRVSSMQMDPSPWEGRSPRFTRPIMAVYRWAVGDPLLPLLPAPVMASDPTVRRRTLSQLLMDTIRWAESMLGDTAGTHNLVLYSDTHRDASALRWLILEAANSDAVAVGIQALGALRWDSPLAELLRVDDRLVDFSETTAFTRSASRRTPTEVLRVSRSVLVMCRDKSRIRLHERVPSLYDLDDNEYPDIALLRLQFNREHLLRQKANDAMPEWAASQRLNDQCDSIAADAPAWRERSPSLASTALCALRANGDSTGLVNVLCCDLDHWSAAEWELAFTVYTSYTWVPDFDKAFYLAVWLYWNYSHRYWIDELQRRILHYVREPIVDRSTSHNDDRLNNVALDFLASQRFHDLHLDPKVLVTLSSYFRLDEHLARHFDVPERSKWYFERSPDRFWGSFARIVYALISSPYLKHVDVGPTVGVCSHALHVLLTLKNISRSSILVLFLKLERPYNNDFMPVPASLWAMLGTMTNRSGAWIEVAAALAAYLDVYLRASSWPDTWRKAEWIDSFFAELSHETVLQNAREVGWDRVEPFVHLLQHCAELRPDWCSDAIGRGRSWDALERHYEEASKRGRCHSCPEFKPEYAS